MWVDASWGALVLPDASGDVGPVAARYPARALPEGAMVTRLAPSPTGELHIGTLYAAFLSYRLACQSGGAFYVRLDDTDQKRETDGSRDRIPRQLRAAGLAYREGYLGRGAEAGAYGPYVQSARAAIYQAYAKALVLQGKAYPCFCTEDALDRLRAQQKAQGVAIGYYGAWARDRDLPPEQVRANLAAGMPYVIRLRSQGDPGQRIRVHDLFKGEVCFPQSLQDVVILKSDGLPTYHFAHVIDDMLMQTTHVIRGDEWLSSLPVHLALFDAVGHPPPVYGHIAPILKKEGAAKRKYSKRRDADGHISYYMRCGVPMRAMQEYYLHLINSAYEDWRMANPKKPLEAYRIDLDNFSVSGAVFDLQKLRSIAREVIAELSATEALAELRPWARVYDAALYDALAADEAYAAAVLAIGRDGNHPRKDITQWSDVRPMLGFFWDALFTPDPAAQADSPGPADFLTRYAGVYSPDDPKDAWFAKLKACAQAAGYALTAKQFALDPARYHGTIADAAATLRSALCGRDTSPDLYDVMRVMGPTRVLRRIQSATEKEIQHPCRTIVTSAKVDDV